MGGVECRGDCGVRVCGWKDLLQWTALNPCYSS